MSSQILSAVVIGGEGFLGHNLVLAVKAKHPQAAVFSFDLTQRSTPQGYSFQSVDLNSTDALLAALKRTGADTVFHTASPWTGASKEICEKVNVQGTSNIINACKEAGVKRLVYTSSGGICFDETPLINIDERLTVPEKYTEHYNETKGKADKLVLEANDPNGLLTCCIRPSGIFGPGDRQAIPGTIQVLKDGKNKYQVGNNENIFDFTYVDNVVHAHLLAAERLHLVIPYETFAEQIGPLPTMPQRRELPTSLHRPSNKWLPNEDQNLVTSTTADIKDFDVPLPARRNRFDQFIGMNPSGEADSKFVTNQIRGTAEGVPVAGQAFYVTNGEPIPFWDFIRAVWFEYDGTSVTQPWVVPPGVALVVATFAEAFATLLRRPTPNMSASRIVHTTTTRYFNIEKARRLLDYEPVVGLQEGIQRAVAWYKETEKTSPELVKA